MNVRSTLIKGFAAGTVLASAALLAPTSASAVDYDPAHHSTDVNDTDPAHHRPVLVFSASTGEAVLTPVAGFDLNGYRLGSGNGSGSGTPAYPAGYDNDPAHHSTDLNDGDPAHHQPYFVYDASSKTWKLVPIPGFDLTGHRVGGATFA